MHLDLTTTALLDPRRLVPRGVHCAPCLTPDGFPLFYAVDHLHRHLPYDIGGVIPVLPGDNPIEAVDRLWDLLNRVDPQPNGITGPNSNTAA